MCMYLVVMWMRNKRLLYCSLQTGDFFFSQSSDFLMTGNLTQIADEIAHIKEDSRQLEKMSKKNIQDFTLHSHNSPATVLRVTKTSVRTRETSQDCPGNTVRWLSVNRFHHEKQMYKSRGNAHILPFSSAMKTLPQGQNCKLLHNCSIKGGGGGGAYLRMYYGAADLQ